MGSSLEIRGLNSDELVSLYNKLLLHGKARYWWIESKIRDTSVEDVIQQTFEDILYGRRNLDPEWTLLSNMCLIMRSKVNHLWEAEKKRLSVEGNDGINITNNIVDVILDQYSRDNPYLMQPNEPADRLAVYNELCRCIETLVADDEVLLAIVKLWFEIPDLKPQEIAQNLKLTMRQLHNAQKRLKSRLRTLREVEING